MHNDCSHGGEYVMINAVSNTNNLNFLTVEGLSLIMATLGKILQHTGLKLVDIKRIVRKGSPVLKITSKTRPK